MSNLFDKLNIDEDLFEVIDFTDESDQKRVELVMAYQNDELIKLVSRLSNGFYLFLPEVTLVYDNGSIDETFEYVASREVNLANSIDRDRLYNLVHSDERDQLLSSFLVSNLNQTIDQLKTLTISQLYELTYNATELIVINMHREMIAEVNRIKKILEEELNWQR